MIQPIVKDTDFLSQKSTVATKIDFPIVQDLIDTIEFHKDNCVGMAANMIGKSKRIIIIKLGLAPIVMINPIVTSQNNSYSTNEGCLSLIGERQVTRYNQITVKYSDINFKTHQDNFSDFIAQIIQHEIDHCNGIIV